MTSTFRLVLLSLLAASLHCATGNATTISNVNRTAVPIGETFTFTGSGFTGTTAATFIWSPYKESASFEVVSDTELRVTFPNVTQNTRDRFFLVETPTGSCVTMAGDVTEFNSIGSLPSSPTVAQVVVNSGAVLQGLNFGTRVVYVKSGGVLQNPPASSSSCVILAESEATLDFRGTTFSTSTPPMVIHSTGTTILGSLPAPTAGIPATRNTPRQVTPLSLSQGIGPFTLGVRVNLTTSGAGSVAVNPPGPFIRHSTSYTLTATPDVGSIFQAWSGSVNSTNPVHTATTGTFDLNIVATFTAGYTLDVLTGSWGSVTRDPDAVTYAPGQSVNLTPVPAPGYQFVGWGADLSGSTSQPASLTMDANKLVTAVFEPITAPAQTKIDSANRSAVPIGETITFTGSGFTGTTAATFIWSPYFESAAFEVLSDSELRVTFPNLTQSIRDYFALVESPTGSCATMAGDVTEFTGVGSLSSSPAIPQVVVQPGAVLQGIPISTRVVYVKSGAVLKNPPAAAASCVILAESGATLDFRGTTFSTTSPPMVFHSAGTTILGNLPAPTSGIPTTRNTPRQVTPLSLGQGVGPFSLGVRINVSTVGAGSVTVDPPGPFIRHSTSYTLTATPDAGSFFQSWSGSIASTNEIHAATTSTSDLNITATFSAGYTLEVLTSSWGSVTRDPDASAYAPGQTVSLTPVPAPGYQFVGWGGGLAGSSTQPASLTMDANKLVTAVFEPVSPPSLTRILSVDKSVVPVGGTMSFTGSGFTGTSQATFIWSTMRTNAPFEVMSDTELRVTLPPLSQGFREHFLLMESPTGSCVTMAGDVLEFPGVGSLPSSPATPQVIVNPGAVLQGIPIGTRVVYVKSGGVLQNPPASASSCVILAEAGAVLDFRNTTFSISSPPYVVHSIGATILGNLPAPTASLPVRNTPRQVTPLSLGRNIGPFREGYPLQLTLQGPGTVTVDPVMDYYPSNTPVTLTAVPNPGKFFVRWTGSLSSVKNPATFTVSSSAIVTARFSDRPDFFSTWRVQFFTPEQLANPAISGLDADPDGDQLTNVGEYAFGTDPTVPNPKGGLKILPGGNPNRDLGLRLEYVRPTQAADVNYILRAQAPGSPWTDGSSGDITFTVTEDKVTPNGQDLEKVTLFVGFTGNIPKTLFFQLSANLEEID
jgi:hypothetical protein